MDSGELTLIVEDPSQRLDKLLAERLEGMSRSAIQGLIAGGFVTAGGKPLAKSAKLAAGQAVTVTLPQPEEPDVLPEDIPISVAYEDRDLLVVNKPKGMVVHPAPGNHTGTLVNALLHYCGDSLSGINGVLRPGIVHRIDKDTSGLLLVAKNDMAHRGLAEQIQAHSLKREYRAVVYGGFKDEAGTIDAPIGRDPAERKRMAVLRNSPGARSAVTHYFVEERLRGFTYLRLRLETGRTHQIRVQFSSRRLPLVGDAKYGGERGELALWCAALRFCHPASGRMTTFFAPPPAAGIWEEFPGQIDETRLCAPLSIQS